MKFTNFVIAPVAIDRLLMFAQICDILFHSFGWKNYMCILLCHFLCMCFLQAVALQPDAHLLSFICFFFFTGSKLNLFLAKMIFLGNAKIVI